MLLLLAVVVGGYHWLGVASFAIGAHRLHAIRTTHRLGTGLPLWQRREVQAMLRAHFKVTNDLVFGILSLYLQCAHNHVEWLYTQKGVDR